MTFPTRFMAGICGLAASSHVLAGTWMFASLRPEYSHIRNTISELGEYGDPLSPLVSFGFFLPVGVLVWLALYLAYPFSSNDSLTSAGLLAFASLGFGYVMSAFFPCDPGSPLFGTWRQHAHNMAGFVEYLGSGTGLIIFGNVHMRAKLAISGTLLILSGMAVIVCLVLMSVPELSSVRGLVQRGAEVIIFGWVTFASLEQPCFRMFQRIYN